MVNRENAQKPDNHVYHGHYNLCYTATKEDIQVFKPAWKATLISTPYCGCLLFVGVVIRKL